MPAGLPTKSVTRVKSAMGEAAVILGFTPEQARRADGGRQLWRPYPIPADTYPGQPREADIFLHVLQVGDRNMQTMDRLELVQEDGRAGVRIECDRAKWEVLFHTKGDLGGHIRRDGDGPAIDVPLSSSVLPQAGIQP